MKMLLDNEKFKQDHLKLKEVTLNPERHSAANAFEHCELVAERVVELAKLNHCTPEQTAILEVLAKVHDIGKIHGNAKPEESLKLIEVYGEVETGFYNLVKYHDVNLPWYISHQKGQSPSDKVWRKLANKVDFRMLCIFMLADRVDCPGGWEANKALVWFLDEAKKRGYLISPIVAC